MKLNQVVSIEKQVKGRVSSKFAELHQTSGKVALFNGFSKSYEPKDAEGEKYPPEKQVVQARAEKSLSAAAELLTDLFDVTAQRDFANCGAGATADVVVDGRVLLTGAPTHYLIFLEKQLVHEVRPFVDALPTLDSQFEWTWDDGLGLYRTEPVRNHKTKKVPQVITKAPATTEHPAQTELVHEDRVVGYWVETKHSGALPAPRKEAVLANLDKLLRAVKTAVQEANSCAAPEKKVGKDLFAFILSK